MNYFDEQAAHWDADLMKIKRAQVFADEIRNFIPKHKTASALEFGCGTGLLSFYLKDVFKTITLADSSEGMIQVLKEKIVTAGIEHFKPVLIDAATARMHAAFDVIYLSMTLHHLIDTSKILSDFNAMLYSNGYLCIADLDKEEGSFHSNQPDFKGLNGFEKEELTQWLVASGFRVVYYRICFEIEKVINDEVRRFPVFLLIAQKND